MRGLSALVFTLLVTAATLFSNAGARQQQIVTFVGLPILDHAAFDAGDVSGDGNPDIFLTGMRPNGEPFTGLFIFQERLVTPLPNSSPKVEAVYQQQSFISRQLMRGTVNWVDLNGDGLEDVIATGTSVVEVTTNQTELRPFTDVYLSRNQGLDIERENGLPGVFDSHVVARDFDGDGRTDILLSGDTGDGNITGLFWNTGSGTSFIEAAVDFGSMRVEDMTAADVTGNELPDILMTGVDSDGTVPVTRFFRNEGNGTFVEQPSPLNALYFPTVAAADLTGNGAAELVSTGGLPDPLLFSGTFTVLENDGNGSFSDGSGLLRDFGTPRPALFRGGTMFGDVNGDGNRDLVTYGLTGLLEENQNQITVYGGTGGAALVKLGDLGGILRGHIRLFDYDGNGRDDIVLMGERFGGLIAQILEF